MRVCVRVRVPCACACVCVFVCVCALCADLCHLQVCSKAGPHTQHALQVGFGLSQDLPVGYPSMPLFGPLQVPHIRCDVNLRQKTAEVTRRRLKHIHWDVNLRQKTAVVTHRRLTPARR